MKKFIVFSLVMLMCGIAFADDTIAKTVYSYGITNTTGKILATVISTSSIRPGVDKVIGYSVMPIDSSRSECYIGLFDGTDNSLSGEVLAENEAAQSDGVAELFPFGKTISDGVVVSQGARTQVQVYFVSK